jgi:hypothetical protein
MYLNSLTFNLEFKIKNRIFKLKKDMALTSQAIRKGVIIKFNNKKVTKQEVLDFSKDWDEKQELFFRKILKAGGRFSMNGVDICIEVEEQLYNSKGLKDSGIITIPGLDTRF